MVEVHYVSHHELDFPRNRQMVMFNLYVGAMIFVDVAVNLFGLVFMVTVVGYGAGKLAIRLVNNVFK